ncbi:MAG: alpha/beta hydrolase [Actinomycetia bacterium]|nr:alpha/beta hydrolase [Actinomycetes bacterium]
MVDTTTPDFRFAYHQGIRIAFRDHPGPDPALVLVHGYRMHGGIWDDVIAALGARHRAVAVDLRGNGASDRPSTGYDLPALAGDVLAVIEAARLDRPVLIGHSMGGTIVQYVMAERPEMLTAAVLVAPVPASGVELPPEAVETFRRSVHDKAVLRQLYEGSVAPGTAVVDRLMTLSATASPAAGEQSLDTWRRASFADRLAGCRVPTLVVAGAHDGLFSRDFLAATLLPRLADARLTVVEAAGHFVPVEAPAALARLITDFVATVTGASA